MYEINKRSAAVMEKLIAELDDGYLKLDNAPGTFMPVVVEQKVMGKEVNLPLQRRLARFADLWFSNIIKQQGITL